MSNSHRPFGNSTPFEDHDLHRDARTDANTNDADALDAWLNEIARNSGTPNTRSGSGQKRPDVRAGTHDGTDDADSLIGTATRFHQRIEAAQSRHARASGPDPHLWETIMERTSAPTPPSGAIVQAATANPRVEAPENHVQTGVSRPQRRSRPRASRQQRVWNTVANIGLVAAILLAVVGVWRLSGGPGLPSGSDDDTPTAPGFAMRASTPEATSEPTEEVPAINPSVATPTPMTDCDFSEDIPIFNGVDESPWDGTAVLLTTSGEVVLTCPEEPEGTVLMTTSQHGTVAPLDWPGVVLIPSYGEKPEEATTRVLNLMSGAATEFGFRNSPWSTQPPEGHLSPWYVGPEVDNPSSDFLLLDLRTFEQRQLSEIAGSALPDDAGIMMSTSEDGKALVLGLRSRSTAESSGALITDSDMPGDLLVVDGSLQTATWISVPDDFPPVTQITVSPDGTHVALHGMTNQFSQDREDTFSVIRARDGKEIERSSVVNDGPETGEGVWVQRGKAFAFVNGTRLMILPLLSDMPEQPVFEAASPLRGLSATTDPSVVLVEQKWGDDLATMVANEEEPILYSVDIGSRDVHTFTGVDVSDNVGWWTPPDRFLVMFEPQADQGDTITYQAIDAVTGETVGTLDDVPLYDPHDTGFPSLGRASVAESPDGNAEIISFDSQHTYLMRVVDGQYQIERLPAPEGTLAQTPLMLSLQFSPNGALVAMSGENDGSGTVYLVDLTPEDLTWQEIPALGNESAYIPFVPGTGVIGESPDWAAEVEARYDFSEEPDGTEFLTSEQLAESLRETEDKFYWPEGYNPDVEAMIARGLGPEGSRHQAGGAYTSLGIYNQCAWNQTWLDAFERGDEEAARKALWIMTEIFPTFPNQDWSVVEAQLRAADLAAEGDPAMVQQHVTVGCQNMHWE